MRGAGTQIWSIVVGMPLCAVGGVFYSWASGQTLVDGFVNAYGALYKIPGGLVFLTELLRFPTVAHATSQGPPQCSSQRHGLHGCLICINS